MPPNPLDRAADLVLAYVGPPLAGKTTNLHVLHRSTSPRARSPLRLVTETQGGPILRFDMVTATGVVITVACVPGAGRDAASRALVDAARAFVFVADVRAPRSEATRLAFEETRVMLEAGRRSIESVPLVVQYNARGEDHAGLGDVQRALGARRFPEVLADTVRGVGITETFERIVAHL
jgi:hypothetical protein